MTKGFCSFVVPDFRGDASCVEKVSVSGLDVFAHNIETVEELQREVRDHRANFKQSIDVLKLAKEYAPAGTLTKTSVMLGCGETPDQVLKTMEKVRDAGVDVMTFGQYMRPSKRHMPVSEYITPEAFEKYREIGMEMVYYHLPLPGLLLLQSIDLFTSEFIRSKVQCIHLKLNCLVSLLSYFRLPCFSGVKIV